jgi:hypothetical protein
VDLLGVLTRGELFSLGGTGTLQVDFLNGQVSTSGQMQWTRTSDGRNFGTLNFTGNANCRQAPMLSPEASGSMESVA